jgi:hypothetical protein
MAGFLDPNFCTFRNPNGKILELAVDQCNTCNDGMFRRHDCNWMQADTGKALKALGKVL